MPASFPTLPTVVRHCRRASDAPPSAVRAPGGDDIETPNEADRLLHAALARATHGISPGSLLLAWTDWAWHLSNAPGKWATLGAKAWRKQARLAAWAAQRLAGLDVAPCIEPLPQDKRFRAPGWQRWPFDCISQQFLLHQQWWHNATSGIGGVSAHHQQLAGFMARQLLDIAAPANFVATNPEVLETALAEGGQNFVRGLQHFAQDWLHGFDDRRAARLGPLRPGLGLACTPGKVVFRNRLIELIQYAPQTPAVHAEPLLVVPAWIMKYYILDLAPHNSLVRYLVRNGFTVFMVSWHNPGAHEGGLGFDDYLRLGVLDALDAVQAIVPHRQVHAAGYCLGGTLLSVAAAWLAQRRRRVLRSLTLLAAQVDFTEAGELKLFIDDSQLAFLDDMMWQQGYLDAGQMAGAFRLLRSNDLLWSRMVSEYLLGRRTRPTDLMAWNADSTRLPWRMHADYLRRFFRDNDLFEGRYSVNGRALALSDIRLPMFAVATETDHVAPWRSVYKLRLLAAHELHFVLASGGHNAGIVSEPGHASRSTPHLPRHFRLARWAPGARYEAPDDWYMKSCAQEGSWWPAWAAWLGRHCRPAPPPTMGAPGYPVLGDAPGSYVLEE